MLSCTHFSIAFYRVRTRSVALAWWGEQAYGRLRGCRHSLLFDLSVDYRCIHSLTAGDRDLTLQGPQFIVLT